MIVTASMVKVLRDWTAVGILDCKTALEETGGDLNRAIELLDRRGKVSGRLVELRVRTHKDLGECRRALYEAGGNMMAAQRRLDGRAAPSAPRAPTSVRAIQEPHERTQVGLMDCKRALEVAGGDLERATRALLQRRSAQFPAPVAGAPDRPLPPQPPPRPSTVPAGKHVFISHSATNAPVANAICAALEQVGTRC